MLCLGFCTDDHRLFFVFMLFDFWCSSILKKLKQNVAELALDTVPIACHNLPGRHLQVGLWVVWHLYAGHLDTGYSIQS